MFGPGEATTSHPRSSIEAGVSSSSRSNPTSTRPVLPTVSFFPSGTSHCTPSQLHLLNVTAAISSPFPNPTHLSSAPKPIAWRPEPKAIVVPTARDECTSSALPDRPACHQPRHCAQSRFEPKEPASIRFGSGERQEKTSCPYTCACWLFWAWSGFIWTNTGIFLQAP